MGTRKRPGPGGRNSRPSRRRPKDRRKIKPSDLRVRTSSSPFESGRSVGESYTLKFRRLLPLDDSSVAVIRRWAAGYVKRTNRTLAYLSAELRTLGPLYESKVIDESDEWQTQWINGVVEHRDGPGTWIDRLMKRLLFRLEEVELRNEGRAIWMSKVRVVLFDTKE